MVQSYTIYLKYFVPVLYTRKHTHSILRSLEFYWIFVTKQMGVVNFQLQNRSDDELSENS